jgi:hypothetical protein
MFSRKSKFEESLKKGTNLLPYSEAVLCVDIPHNPDGSQSVDDDYIKTEKDKKLAALRDKYGEIDEKEITWMIVKTKSQDSRDSGLESTLTKTTENLFKISKGNKI